MSSYSRASDLYDVLYGEFKDYRSEVAKLLEIFSRSPAPVRRVLDVACGTGMHARFLAEAGLAVDGLDLEPAFVRIAQARNPGGRFREGDMTAFEVDEPYDAVLCLFGSIGHVVTEPRLRAAVRCLAEALRPEGLLVLEPWFEPGAMEDGFVHMTSARSDDMSVCRMSRTSIVGGVSRLEFEYLVGRATGIERFSEVHELGLFSRATMEDALREVGLSVTHDPSGLIGRGLYLAVKAEP